MINRRFDDRASCLPGRAWNKRLKESHEFPRLLLGNADMRVLWGDRIDEGTWSW